MRVMGAINDGMSSAEAVRLLSSTSTWRTQPRRGSGCMPNCSAILGTASDLVAGSFLAWTAIRSRAHATRRGTSSVLP